MILQFDAPPPASGSTEILKYAAKCYIASPTALPGSLSQGRQMHDIAISPGRQMHQRLEAQKVRHLQQSLTLSRQRHWRTTCAQEGGSMILQYNAPQQVSASKEITKSGATCHIASPTALPDSLSSERGRHAIVISCFSISFWKRRKYEICRKVSHCLASSIAS